MPGVWNVTYAAGLSSAPVCWSRLRLETEPEVDPFCDVREAGDTTLDCMEDGWVEVAVGVFDG